MDDLLSIIRHDFPGLEVTHIFQAGIPVYFAQFLVEVLKPQALTSFEIYFLHAVALAVDTREDIAALLGLDDLDLVTPGASLLKREMISQGSLDASGRRRVSLTAKGREFLATQKVPPVPIRAAAQVHLNAMTWTPIPVEETWSIDRMDKEGLYILPLQRHERPTLGDFTLKEIEAALRHVPFFQENRLVKLIELKKTTPEYIAPVSVIALCERDTHPQRFAVYRNGLFQRGESAVLQRLSETGQFLPPSDAVTLTGERPIVPSTLPEAFVQTAIALTENASRLRKLQTDLTESQTRQNGTTDQDERTTLKLRIAKLEEDLRRVLEESEQLKSRLKLSQGTFLHTEEHRGVLERALKEAREEVIIISPWLNRRTCDDTLCKLIATTIKRSVRVRIGYGITERVGDPDVGRNRANAQKVIRALQTAVEREAESEQASLLDIQRTRDTHEKILVCDRTFAVIGSFNWLSYRGELDREYRKEASFLLREPSSVAELARIALKEWPNLQE